MENSSVQCQKSADELYTKLEKKAEHSPGISEVIRNGRKILFLFSKNVPQHFKDYITSLASGKETTTINVPFIVDDESASLDFFGVTKKKTPILLNKAFLAHDTVIVCGIVRYNGLLGFNGGKFIIFPGLASRKSARTSIKTTLDESVFYKNKYTALGIMKHNPIDADSLDAVMIIQRNVNFFGINLIPDTDGDIADLTCGDLFMSHITATDKFSKMYPLKDDKAHDGIILHLGNSSIEDSIDAIEQASLSLMDGGRMLIDGDNLESFGSEEFSNIFFINGKEDIFRAVQNEPSLSKYRAMVIKHLCGRYHIAIHSPIDEKVLIQAGFNPIKQDEAESFLKNCSDLGEVYDAGGFTARR